MSSVEQELEEDELIEDEDENSDDDDEHIVLESSSDDVDSQLSSEEGESECSELPTSVSGKDGGKMLLEAEDTDTSDEEEVRNTVGNIPLEWYDDLPHIGYDIEGKTIAKSSLAKGDEVVHSLCMNILKSNLILVGRILGQDG